MRFIPSWSQWNYPDAITDGLRRRTDLARGIIERTRADVTVAYREAQLAQKLDQLSGQLATHN